jgi:hypothetical protein
MRKNMTKIRVLGATGLAMVFAVGCQPYDPHGTLGKPTFEALSITNAGGNSDLRHIESWRDTRTGACYLAVSIDKLSTASLVVLPIECPK